jgi:hypothetical protein
MFIRITVYFEIEVKPTVIFFIEMLPEVPFEFVLRQDRSNKDS